MSETTQNDTEIIITEAEFGFMAQLMEQSANDTAWSVNATIDAEKRRADRAEATLLLIRNAMYELLGNPWTPSSGAIRYALEPSEEEIEELMGRMC